MGPFVPSAADHSLHVNRGQVQESVLFIRSVTWERVKETPGLQIPESALPENLDHDTDRLLFPSSPSSQLGSLHYLPPLSPSAG